MIQRAVDPGPQADDVSYFPIDIRQLEKCASNNSQTAQEPTHTLRAQTVQVRGGEEREGEGKRPGAKKEGKEVPFLVSHTTPSSIFFSTRFPHLPSRQAVHETSSAKVGEKSEEITFLLLLIPSRYFPDTFSLLSSLSPACERLAYLLLSRGICRDISRP